MNIAARKVSDRWLNDRIQFWMSVLWYRIWLSIKVRPWVADVGCSICAISWGFWIGYHHELVYLSKSLGVFSSLIDELSIISITIGVLQLCGALLKLNLVRQFSALGFIFLWGGISYGISTYSGQAAYAGYAFLNMLILIRFF